MDEESRRSILMRNLDQEDVFSNLAEQLMNCQTEDIGSLASIASILLDKD
jgi:hypothetical protein